MTTLNATSTTPSDTGVTLELHDIQAGALYPRPSPYAGAYILLRIDDRRAGPGGRRTGSGTGRRPAHGQALHLPEAAGVGATEEQVRAMGIPYIVGRCDLAATARGAISGHGGG